jgi:hypothetical protein
VIIDAQKGVPRQYRKAVTSLGPTPLLNAQNLPHSFHPRFRFKAGKHWEEDIEPDLRPYWRADPGQNERSYLADVVSVAFAPFFNSAVRPPKHNRRFQGEPNGFAALSWRFLSHPRHMRRAFSNT